MSLLFTVIVISLYLFNGIIIYRFIAIRLLKADRYLSETKIIAPGFILGIVINNILGQYLAIFHLFRFWVFILIFVVSLLALRREALATLRYMISIPQHYWHLLKNGYILQAVFWGCFLLFIIINFFRVQIPSTSIDIYSFHLPIAKSIIKNAGFIYPGLISHNFYGSQPAFIDLLFAQGLALNSTYEMVSAMHYTVFVAFLISLLSFAPKNRWIALLTIMFIFNVPSFLSTALTGLNDAARACFAVLGVVFLARYFQKRVIHFLVFSGLLVGAALASKYVEISLLSLTVAAWLFCLVTGRDNLKRLTLYFSLVFLVAGFWYIKNLVVWGNPLYPFVFGHPGLSDAWMAETLGDLKVAFHPEYRHYSRDIFSLTGWLDCLKAICRIFLPGMQSFKLSFFAYATFLSILAVNTITRPKYKKLAVLAGLTYLLGIILIPSVSPFNPASFMVIILIVCLFLGDNETTLVTAATLAYLAGYYFFVFHDPRYGITGHLLLYTAFYLALMTVIDNIEQTSLYANGMARLQALGPRRARAGVFLLSIYLALFLCRVLAINPAGSLKNDNREVVVATFTKGGIQNYLSNLYPFYGLYSFVVQNKLRRVLNPLDNGATFYVRYLIPGNKPDDTFLPYTVMPPSLEALDDFLKEHHIEYFVRIDLHSQVAIDRLGSGHGLMVNRMYEKLLPRSTRVYADKHGYELFRITH